VELTPLRVHACSLRAPACTRHVHVSVFVCACVQVASSFFIVAKPLLMATKFNEEFANLRATQMGTQTVS